MLLGDIKRVEFSTDGRCFATLEANPSRVRIWYNSDLNNQFSSTPSDQLSLLSNYTGARVTILPSIDELSYFQLPELTDDVIDFQVVNQDQNHSKPVH